MRFATEITLSGPLRSPAQMLADQEIGGHTSIHDEQTAASLGLTGAPIEAPTHFSQFDPLAVLIWGDDWFARGCISGHFRTMVVEGEQVQASLTTGGSTPASIEAHKPNGTPVLIGTASLGPDYGETELEARRGRQDEPGQLYIIDQLQVGSHRRDGTVSKSFAEPKGPGYPF